MRLHDNVVSLMEIIWTQQRRYFTLEGLVLDTPQFVDTSLPQGDAWSMIGMVVTLVGPLADIQSRCLTLYTFVDDRSFATDNVQSLKEAPAARWARWLGNLGRALQKFT